VKAGIVRRRLALVALLALAGCSEYEPPEELKPSQVSSAERVAVISTEVPPAVTPDTTVEDRLACVGECSEDDGYRWAVQQGVTNPERCGGPLPFLEGCRRYAFEHEDGHDLSR
jgi:hypothetical protein